MHDELNAPAYGVYGPSIGIHISVFEKDYERWKLIVDEILILRSQQKS